MNAFAYLLVTNRADADDIVQESLVALWNHFDDYDPSRPFLPWANRFLYRQVLMYRRKQATLAKYSFSGETIEHLACDEPFSLERDWAMDSALENYLLKLSPKNRDLVELWYLSKGSLHGYAEQVGSSSNATY